MIFPNQTAVELRWFKPGTLLLIHFVKEGTTEYGNRQELRLIQTGGSFCVIAANENSFRAPIDNLEKGCTMVPYSIVKVVSRSELPLYMSDYWHKGAKFMQVLKGEY